jgi:hypothetical protein
MDSFKANSKKEAQYLLKAFLTGWPHIAGFLFKKGAKHGNR